MTRGWSRAEYHRLVEAGLLRPTEPVELIGGYVYPAHKWTRDEYYKLADLGFLAPDERVELIEGEIIPMCPQKSFHAAGIQAAQEVLGQVFTAGHNIRIQLPLDLGLISEPEPDVAVVVGSWRDYVAHHPRTAQLVVEVADTTLSYDRGWKACLYAKAGIPELWIVNLPERLLEVYREPVAMAGQPFEHGYQTVLRLDTSAHVAPLAAPESSIAVADLLP